MRILSWPLTFLYAAVIGLLLVAINFIWHSGFSWHDNQRLIQLLILTLASGALLFTRLIKLPTTALAVLLTIFALGFISSLLAEYPWWAFKEWAKYIALFLLTLFIAQTAQRSPYKTSLLLALALVAFINAYQFLVYYAMAFITGIYLFDADVLFNGFSNPRFLNQFQILLMPLLAFLVIDQWHKTGKYQRALASIIALVLIVHWCIALTLGGRGLWLGLAVSHGVVLVAFPRYRSLVWVQAAAGIAGFLLFYLMFILIPEWLELSPTLRDSLRTGLSSREIIWQQAWDLFIVNPWLGVGPLHFSAYPNSIAAHPHQVVLQWLAEWGLFATALATAIAAWGMWHGLRWVRSAQSQSLDAALWVSIAAALVLAQVDGVFVMPYTETWLAIIIGLAMAQWRKDAKPMPRGQLVLMRALALPAILVLGYVLLFEVPTLAADIDAYLEAHSAGYKPRFWIQGFIPM